MALYFLYLVSKSLDLEFLLALTNSYLDLHSYASHKCCPAFANSDIYI